MDHPKLTPSQSAVLFVLMAESTELSTPRLRELGPNLDKPGRQKLTEHGLIESRKGERNALYHSLTDRGWAWCADELRAGPPDRSLPPIRALYAVLNAIGRHLDAEDFRLYEVFGRPRPVVEAAPPASSKAANIGARIIATYESLAHQRGALVDVAALRSALPDVGHSEFNAAILELQDRPGVSLIPQDDRARLSETDRAAAVVVGTQPCHLFAVEED